MKILFKQSQFPFCVDVLRKTGKASFKTVGDLLISCSGGRCIISPKGHDILWDLSTVNPVHGVLLYAVKRPK